MIETEQLSKVYGKRLAVNDLNLVVDRGEAFGFPGPNGAGKTTTIRILSTLTSPSSGRAWINGFDVLEEPWKVKEEFGIVQQHMSLSRELTVRENLELHGRLYHIEKKVRERRIDEILDYAGLGEFGDQLIEWISGGMTRRSLGLFTVESRRRDNDTEYRYFPDRFAAVEVAERLFEAEKRGYWEATAEEMEKLREAYLQMEGDIEDNIGEL